uniref:Nucleoside phosphorylase domain-containing protein n=1 Tax=Quercus lobata TaxID=97700 RepID=A0A7N2MJ53_QUELO
MKMFCIMGSAEENITELKFGNFDFPEKGENLLAMIDFTPQQLYSVGKPMEEDVKLQQCVNETYCLPETPKVVYGLRGSTADIYLDNAAYREFLFKSFNVAAIVMTSLSNGVPCIVFRRVLDYAGGEGLLS